jgi:phosphatidylserine/phosphatidylglycerophosphate/cardiolipin synthase-like enzyme/uncharacterized membrane protein YdjX (TVP38/TMEM64 family)
VADQPRITASEDGLTTGTTERVAQRAAVAAGAIVQPGRNCWRVERAYQFFCVQDAADYFRLVRQALLDARKTVFILGWDILATVDLLPGAAASDAPTRLADLLAFVARRRPHLRCYILIWDYAALYSLERDPFSRWRLGWRTPRHVRFGFDDRHPVGGSHHQKIVVVDDQLAFCGGTDLTGHRWDTSAHRVEEPARTSAGEPYEPYHEVQAMVSGPVATSLGLLARDRWRALGEEQMPPVGEPTAHLWPSDLTADLTDVDIAIARTMPGSDAQTTIRECEALFLDSIAKARRTIYVESQYFTNDMLSGALAARLTEPDGPEILVVVPRECHGWLEVKTMGEFRASAFRQLIAADRFQRLRIVYPIASRAQQVPTFIHSKVMVVDDTLVRIGSANFSRRSMGVDTECDLAVDACGNPQIEAGIRNIRNRLLAEHLSLTSDDVAREIQRLGSLRALVDAREGAEHTLLRIEVPEETESPSAAVREAADPDEPIRFGSTVTHLVPPADAANGLRPFRIPIPSIVLMAAVASSSAVLVIRSEVQVVQEALIAIPRLPGIFWTGIGTFILGNLVLIPLELMVIAMGVLFGALHGGVIALIGSLAAAAIGYVAGRTLGASGVVRWMSWRSYRSARQLGAQGVIGVVMLRLASVASAQSIHLLCGAGRVSFATYMAGTAIGLIPMLAALTMLGGLLRRTLLYPSLSNGFIATGTAVFLVCIAAALRTLLLARQFAPSVASHRNRAEFG